MVGDAPYFWLLLQRGFRTCISGLWALFGSMERKEGGSLRVHRVVKATS